MLVRSQDIGTYAVHALLLHVGHLFAELTQFLALLQMLFVLRICLGFVDHMQKVHLVVVQATNEVFCTLIHTNDK